MSFSFEAQLNRQDCGASCLIMLARFHGCKRWEEQIREQCPPERQGSSVEQLLQVAKNMGFKALAVRLPSEGKSSLQTAPLPAIAYLPEGHFVFVYKRKGQQLYIADPAKGAYQCSQTEFEQRWLADAQKQGVLLLFEAQEAFFNNCPPPKSAWTGLRAYIRPHRRTFLWLLLSLLLGAGLQLLFPLITQAVVDRGIKEQDIDLIYLLLIGQVVLFSAQAGLQVLRNWQLLLVGGKMQVQMLGDFVRKLLRLPQRFFDQRPAGDLLQRLQDHQRVERLLTTAALRLIFATLSFVVFGAVLAWYSRLIFGLFVLGSALYVIWIMAFLKKRRRLDEAYFRIRSQQKEQFLELLAGQADIQLHQLQESTQADWDEVQERLFLLQKDSLKLAQYQESGAQLINQLKNISLTFLAAVAVVEDDLTLGMMLAIQFIVGQLNVPLNEAVSFIQQAQDARLSWARIRQIRKTASLSTVGIAPPVGPAAIRLKQLGFRYHPHDDYLFQDLNMLLPAGQLSLLQGVSGVGKTTLLRLLLRLYEPVEGGIYIAEVPLSDISVSAWRKSCGVVWEQGFIFDKSVAYNISLQDKSIDWPRLRCALAEAQLQDWLKQLPRGYQSQLGRNGQQLSKGQRQRLLLARLFYQNPNYVFLDEPLQGLDDLTSKKVEVALRQFLKGKTSLWISHRDRAADNRIYWADAISS